MFWRPKDRTTSVKGCLASISFENHLTIIWEGQLKSKYSVSDTPYQNCRISSLISINFPLYIRGRLLLWRYKMTISIMNLMLLSFWYQIQSCIIYIWRPKSRVVNVYSNPIWKAKIHTQNATNTLKLCLFMCLPRIENLCIFWSNNKML